MRRKETIELKRSNIKTLIGLFSKDTDRGGGTKEEDGFYHPEYFCDLAYLRNEFVVTPLHQERLPSISDYELVAASVRQRIEINLRTAEVKCRRR